MRANTSIAGAIFTSLKTDAMLPVRDSRQKSRTQEINVVKAVPAGTEGLSQTNVFLNLPL